VIEPIFRNNSKVIFNKGEDVHFDTGFRIEYGSIMDVPEK